MNALKRFWLFALIAVVLMVGAAACGGGDGADDAASAPAPAATTSDDAAAAAPEAAAEPEAAAPSHEIDTEHAAEAPKHNEAAQAAPSKEEAEAVAEAKPTPAAKPAVVVASGTLKVAMSEAGTESGDPGISQSPDIAYGGGWMFSWLLGTEPGGVLSTDRGLAKNWWIGDSGDSFTFELDEDAYWHDGIQFVADDVVFTFQDRLPAPDSICTLCGQIRTGVKEVAVIDDHTVEFILNQTEVTFFSNVSSRDTNHWLIPRRNFELKDDGGYKQIGDPIGTGPWKFVSRKLGESLHLVANENYHQKDNLPEFANVDIYVRPEAAVRLASVQTGEIDFAPILPVQVPEAMAAGLQVDGQKGFGVHSIAFRAPYDPAFKNYMGNLDFRKALTLSLDLDAMAEAIFPEGLREVQSTLMWNSPGAVGYVEGVERYQYDPIEAKAALERSGYDGKPIKVWVYTLSIAPEWPDIIQLAAAYWDQIGINLVYEQIDFFAFLDMELASPHGLGNEGLAGHMAMDLWPARPTALNNIAVAWISMDAGGLLRNHHDPAGQDALYNQARTATTLDELNTAIQSIQVDVHNDYAGGIPFVIVHNWWAMSDVIESWDPGDLGFCPHYETLKRAK
jgi:peptide/nickel transport system substrate-binding protein